MSGSKHFDRIAIIITVVTVVIALLFINGQTLGIGVAARTMGYESRLFDNTRVHSLDIVMDDDEWDDLIGNATSEEYHAATAVIDGEAYANVGIRAKGNTSLSTVANLDSDRYSFKIEFDHYDSTETYHGLDKLSLNNLIQDATMMKDYLVYTMMNAFDVNSPLCSFTYITVNGEDWGLYLAVEGVEDSFLERTYGADYGELYKPDSMSMGGGRGNGRDFDMDEFIEENEDSADGDGGATDDGNSSGDSGDSSGDGDRSNSSGFSPPGGGAMPDMPGGAMPTMPSDGSMPDMSDLPDMPGGGFGGNGGGMPNFSPFGNGDDTNSDDDSDDSSGNDSDSDSGDGSSDSGSSDSTSGAAGGFNPFDQSGGFGGGNGGGPGGGGGGMGSSDVKLQYIDDNLDSYTNIWSNAKTDVTESDEKRLVTSLKQLGEYTDVNEVVDVEQVIRYFVVHNYVCNGDSYTGSMIHNYYLYEDDGRMAMIPWDYNLAFGGFGGGDATSTVNTPIDSPVSNGDGSDRPMWYWIVNDSHYTEQYHEYFADFLESVDIQSIIDNAYELIQPYVEKDPTKFYTTDEFEAGVATLRKFCQYRSAAIANQLESGETTTETDSVDASDITLSDMGSMNMGGGQGGGGQGGPQGGFGGFGGRSHSDTATSSSDDDNDDDNVSDSNSDTDAATEPSANPSEPAGTAPSGFSSASATPSAQPGGEPSESPSASPSASPSVSASDDGATNGQTNSTQPQSPPDAGDGNDNAASGAQAAAPGGGGFPPGGAATASPSASSAAAAWILLAASVVILGVGLLVAWRFKG